MTYKYSAAKINGDIKNSKVWIRILKNIDKYHGEVKNAE